MNARNTVCLREGPLAASANNMIVAAHRLGVSPSASQLRSWCIPYLFENMERAFASKENPVKRLKVALKKTEKFLNSAFCQGFGNIGYNRNDPDALRGATVREVTGEHYGRLFERFSPRSFWDEPKKLLQQRLQRNGITKAIIQGKRVLDAGCGGGRYTVAWRLLGARCVTGIDASLPGIVDANKRIEEVKKGIFFLRGDVLNLPFRDNSFDIVFSNGVLHHTVDWRKGISEMVRVLVPRGLGWLYLIENPGGLFWDTIEILRIMMKNDPKNLVRASLASLGIPANRIFYMLDHVMVPINLRLTPDEIVKCLSVSGAIKIKRLKRGTDFDRVERIYRKETFSVIKYGVGENRFMFSKTRMNSWQTRASEYWV